MEMRAQTAAAYCDEPSVEAFLAKVQRGIYSAPIREKSCLPNGTVGNLIRTLRVGMDYVLITAVPLKMQRI